MTTISINEKWLAQIKSLCAKASPDELYVLHGMLIFQQTVYSATGAVNVHFNLRRAETILIDAVTAHGGYSTDKTVLAGLRLDGAQ